MEGQMSIFDFSEFLPELKTKPIKAYPCDDCIWLHHNKCAFQVNVLQEFCKYHKSKNIPCNLCFHEAKGICSCNHSEYFNQRIPMDKTCSYYDKIGEVE